MEKLSATIQSGDWKGEKHVPIIHAPESVQADQAFEIGVSIGDEISHPNTLEHHIVWMKVFFKPDSGKFPVEVTQFNFSANGEYDNYTEYVGKTEIKVKESGTLYAISYCNIHGLWENSKKVEVK